MIALLTPAMLARINLTIRCAQFLCCLLGMAFVAAGGITFHSSNFVLLMNYSGMLYTLWFVGAVELFHLSSRLSLRVEQGVDIVLIIMLFISGICLATSDYLEYCNLSWHCHNLKASVAFTFIGMFCFIATLTLSILTTTKTPSGPTEVPGQYHLEMTPTGGLSPVDGLNSPGAKVSVHLSTRSAQLQSTTDRLPRANQVAGAGFGDQLRSTSLTIAPKRQVSSVESPVNGAAPSRSECVQRAGSTGGGKMRHDSLELQLVILWSTARIAAAASRVIPTFVLSGSINIMSLAMVLAVGIPIVLSVLVIALMFKFVPGLYEAFSSLCNRQEHDKTRERIEVEVGGAMMSPEPYHMTWPTPASGAYSPFAETPKAATYPGLHVIERPSRSPRVMTSLVSPIRTGCSPPKCAIRGEQRPPHSPVAIPTVSLPVLPFGRLV
ncbi:unnamed protein product [Phytophthora fragariaefolia]|uniref:Unnamed protein product n=1 Tax=Phytophthora fragariaefolia TaxID=1490495 RepID=A0A9W6Y5R7_9STRA|nr:unnamed protein product [Phytophthora fragariaefolia]